LSVLKQIRQQAITTNAWDVIATLPPHPLPAVLVKPGDRALDGPTLASAHRAVRALGRRNPRLDMSYRRAG
jgi:hypothetical protein